MRHFTRPRRNFHVRLACVRHAASVQSEPESNSPVENLWFCLNYIESKQLNSKLILFHFALQFSKTCPRKLSLQEPLSVNLHGIDHFTNFEKRFAFFSISEVRLCTISFRLSRTFFIFFIFFQKTRSTPEQRSALMPLIPALVNLNLQFLKNYFNFNF